MAKYFRFPNWDEPIANYVNLPHFQVSPPEWYTQIDPATNFEWDSISAGQSVVWEGFIIPVDSGMHKFKILSNGKIKLYFENLKLFENIEIHPTEFGWAQELSRGKMYAVQIEYSKGSISSNFFKMFWKFELWENYHTITHFNLINGINLLSNNSFQILNVIPSSISHEYTTTSGHGITILLINENNIFYIHPFDEFGNPITSSADCPGLNNGGAGCAIWIDLRYSDGTSVSGTFYELTWDAEQYRAAVQPPSGSPVGEYILSVAVRANGLWRETDGRSDGQRIYVAK